MKRKIIPDVVEARKLVGTTKEATVQQAATAMAEADIAAIVVTDDDGRLIGILTERDMTRRLVAENLPAKTTLVGDIMTANPDALAPDDSAIDALELMMTRRYRHLPVVDDDGRCLAMVSIRDLFATGKEVLEENIRDAEAFAFGDRYS